MAAARRRPFLVVLLLAAPAAADQLVPALGQRLSEVSHTVEIRLEDGVARYRVERVFANEGKIADEASLDIDLPFGGAVTGLRIRARDKWYDGDLMEAGKAAELYHELTGRGAYPVKDPALMQWVWADKVHLQVFPVLPGRTSTVEYTITVPTRYEHGRWLLSYPRFNGGPLARPVIKVLPIAGAEAGPIEIDGRRAAMDAPFQLEPPPPDKAWDGGVARDPHASYALSRLPMSGRGAARKARLELDITHTYKGDLRVELVTPAGKILTLHDRQGGDKNDVRGRFELDLPEGTPAAGTWRLVVSDHAARDVGTINAWTLALDGGAAASAADTPVFIPDAPEGGDDFGLVTIAVPAPPIDTVTARLGRVVASDAHAFLRLELDVARELRPLPKGAQVVFVVDASHSMGPAGIAAQLALARAYLSHVPDASFEIVLYRRTAEALGFAPATRFDAVVAAARAAGRLEPGNGSALDAGIAAATATLAKRRGPHRIVVLGDALLRPAFENALALRALAAAPDDTVVHVVITGAGDAEEDEPEERQDDGHPLAPIAAARKGILVHLTGVKPGAKGLEAVVLHLVRPTRIDQLRVTGAVLDDAALIPETLREGTGVRAMAALPRAPTSLVLDGKIWGEPFHRVVAAGRPFSQATAAFVFSEHQYTELGEAEMMKVALEGRAVSPVTSYLAVEPGVRPSPIGLLRAGEGRGTIGHGEGRGVGAGYGGAGLRRPPDLQELASPGAEACVRKHPPARGWSLEVAVDTTLDEIVDVVPPASAGTPVDNCIVEAIWALRLDPRFDRAAERFTLRFAR